MKPRAKFVAQQADISLPILWRYTCLGLVHQLLCSKPFLSQASALLTWHQPKPDKIDPWGISGCFVSYDRRVWQLFKSIQHQLHVLVKTGLSNFFATLENFDSSRPSRVGSVDFLMKCLCKAAYDRHTAIMVRQLNATQRTERTLPILFSCTSSSDAQETSSRWHLGDWLYRANTVCRKILKWL